MSYLCAYIADKRIIMSTATLTGLLDYLYATLTPSNMRWVGEHLIERAAKEEQPPKPYTMEEINAMLDAAEAEIAAGKGIPDEEMWDELDEELSREEKEPELAEAV